MVLDNPCSLKNGVMAQTVIGIFENDTQANAAAERLKAEGFSSENVNISLQEETAGRGDVSDEKNTLDSKIGKYFRGVFENTNDALRYAAVAQQGAVVSLHTDTYDDAIRAANLMDAYGAINVDERSVMLEDSLTREDRTSGHKRSDDTPQVKSFPGIAENERPSGFQTERTVISRPAGENIRVHSRIVDRTTRGEGTVREEHLWIEPDENNSKEKTS
jgi:hypothetical protein